MHQEEGELVELPPKRGPATGPIKSVPFKAPNRPPAKMMQVAAGPGRVPTVSTSGPAYRLPPNAYKSAQFTALLNLLTEPGPNKNEFGKFLNANGEVNMAKVNAERARRENQGRKNAEAELIKVYKARGIESYVRAKVAVPEYKPLVLHTTRGGDSASTPQGYNLPGAVQGCIQAPGPRPTRDQDVDHGGSSTRAICRAQGSKDSSHEAPPSQQRLQVGSRTCSRFRTASPSCTG